MSLRERVLLPEMMDRPGLEPVLYDSALRGLERINLWSGTAGSLWPPIRRLARGLSPRPVRVLDLATGAGDVPIALWRKARAAGIALEVHGCDINPRALEHATRRAEAQHAEVQFFRLNALEETLPSGYDVLVSSLFLHHLADEAACRLMARMAEASVRMVCVNDLLRTRRGLALAYWGGRALSRSPVVRSGARQSVRAAFTLEEVSDLATRAGLRGFRLKRLWPCRFLLSWTRS